jgi:predicted anti-sigma-YlaC factor YlaD
MDNHTVQEMACQELVEVITEYLEGTLPESDRVRFDAHLTSCASCREYLDQMRALVRLTGKLTVKSIEPSTRDTLLRSFRRWRDARTGL